MKPDAGTDVPLTHKGFSVVGLRQHVVVPLALVYWLRVTWNGRLAELAAGLG
jgi:hypothetical protein